VFILVADQPGAFATEHAEIAQEVANSLTVAIQQARLREELHRHATHLETSLQEKEVLLREIHHRVKNNLQVISSLLSLQSDHVTDERAVEVFQDGQNRIRSMALVHEKLYQSENLAWVDFAEYIVSLSRYLFRAYRNHAARVRLDIDTEDVLLDVDSALTCGLIVNELVSNALKHAFPVDREGEIRVQLHTDGDRHVVLRVGDNGIGLSHDLDVGQTESLGLRLVNILVEQLDGTIALHATSGTAFEIRFAHPGEGS
jgi:two-component sensor histidine kinase